MAEFEEIMRANGYRVHDAAAIDEAVTKMNGFAANLGAPWMFRKRDDGCYEMHDSLHRVFAQRPDLLRELKTRMPMLQHLLP